MTIILQHQFWDLVVNDYGFEVGLSFGGITERLSIPFEAINGFFDPSVQFGLQFEEVAEGQIVQTPANGQSKAPDQVADKSKKKPSALSGFAPPPASPPPALASVPKPDPDPKPDKPAGGGGEVVRLDRFRKK